MKLGEGGWGLSWTVTTVVWRGGIQVLSDPIQSRLPQKKGYS